MDELTKAVAPYLHSSGGMPGGSATPPGPMGDIFIIPMEGETQEEGTPAPAPNAAPGQAPNAGTGQREEGPPFEVYPYADDQVIGGDSVNSIKRRLLGSKSMFPSSQEIDECHLEAQDLMEVKAEIIKYMSLRDPKGDWEVRGARALDNPRCFMGENSLKNLTLIRDDLWETGVLSESFSGLQDKVFRLP